MIMNKIELDLYNNSDFREKIESMANENIEAAEVELEKQA